MIHDIRCFSTSLLCIASIGAGNCLATTSAKELVQVPIATLPESPKSKIMINTQLTWTAVRIGSQLRVSYQYRNTGKAVVYVNDGAVQQVSEHLWVSLKTHFVSVSSADTALLTIGVPIGSGTAPTPGLYVPVAPGTSFASSRDIDAPLQFESGDGRWRPLPRTVTKLALALELFEGEPSKWVQVKTDTGQAKFPLPPAVWTVQTEAKPLP